jgi:hypothetical protein
MAKVSLAAAQSAGQPRFLAGRALLLAARRLLCALALVWAMMLKQRRFSGLGREVQGLQIMVALKVQSRVQAAGGASVADLVAQARRARRSKRQAGALVAALVKNQNRRSPRKTGAAVDVAVAKAAARRQVAQTIL